MWSVYGEECQNVSVMAGHKGAIMELHFSPSGENIYTCSTDKFLSVWSVETGQRIRKMKGHQNFVNSLGNARRGVDTLVSGSDDNTSKNLLNLINANLLNYCLLQSKSGMLVRNLSVTP